MGRLLLGNCLDKLKVLEDNSIDSIVTDPPYGLSFMGKAWDYDVPTVEIWKECLRVLKPGGHLLAFGGTRTYHRLVVAIEDAGFEIRDQIQWIYGQGFPKSMDISKAIDKEAGATREVIGTVKKTTISTASTNDGWSRPSHFNEDGSHKTEMQITTPATPEAKQWSGWGTALKPANEPICLARKPLSEKTVAKNVLKHGTGGLNIDGSRVATDENLGRLNHTPSTFNRKNTTPLVDNSGGLGRFPANVIFDESAAEVLDEQSGVLRARGNKTAKDHGSEYEASSYQFGGQESGWAGDAGGASRFFATFKQDTQCDPRDSSTAMHAEQSSKRDEARLNSVQEVVRTNCNKDPLLSHCLDSIPDYKKCTLYQDLASLADAPESIDTTLIMRSLLKLYGSAHLVTDESTKLAKNGETVNTEFVPTRFLYQAKASKKDRNTGLEGSGIVNNHATVKPIKLMEYLVKLVTPEGGTVLDPFMGSGTTGVAAVNEGFDFIGCEMSTEYFEIAKTRVIGAKTGKGAA